MFKIYDEPLPPNDGEPESPNEGVRLRYSKPSRHEGGIFNVYEELESPKEGRRV